MDWSCCVVMSWKGVCARVFQGFSEDVGRLSVEEGERRRICHELKWGVGRLFLEWGGRRRIFHDLK